MRTGAIGLGMNFAKARLEPFPECPMRTYVPIALAFALIFAGCGKRDDGPPAPVPPMKRDVPLVPAPPLPKVAPDANPAPGPAPGQANDHSNPAFKGGGLPEPKK